MQAQKIIYAPFQAAIATLIGGPLAIVVCLRNNYLALGKRREAQLTTAIGILLFFVLLSLVPVFEFNLLLFYSIVLFIFLARYLVNRLQFNANTIAQNNAIRPISGMHLLTMAVITLFSTMALSFLYWFLLTAIGFKLW